MAINIILFFKIGVDKLRDTLMTISFKWAGVAELSPDVISEIQNNTLSKRILCTNMQQSTSPLRVVGTKIAIDAMICMYTYANCRENKQFAIFPTDSQEIINAKFFGLMNSLSLSLLELLKLLRINNIDAILVFDNKVSRVRAGWCRNCRVVTSGNDPNDQYPQIDQLQCRCGNSLCDIFDFSYKRELRAKAAAAAKEATVHIPTNMARMIAYGLAGWGFPVAFAMTEGERGCAHLVKTGECSAVLTKDTDVVCMGTPLIWIKNYLANGAIEFCVDDPSFFYAALALERTGLSMVDYFATVGALSKNDIEPNETRYGPVALATDLTTNTRIAFEKAKTRISFPFFNHDFQEQISYVNKTYNLQLLSSISAQSTPFMTILEWFKSALVPAPTAPVGSTQKWFNEREDRWIYLLPGEIPPTGARIMDL